MAVTPPPVLSVKVPSTFPSSLLDVHLQTPFDDTTARVMMSVRHILRHALLSRNQEQQCEAFLDCIMGSIAVSDRVETFRVITLSHEANTDDSFIALNPSRQFPGYVSDIAADGVVHFANGHFALVPHGVAANITRVAIRDTSAGDTLYGVTTIGYSVVHSTFVARYDEEMCAMGTEWTLLHCDRQHRAHCMAPLASTVVHTQNDRDCNDDCSTNTCSPAPVEIKGPTSLFASMRMKYCPFDRGGLIMDQAAACNTDNCPGSLTKHVVNAMVVDANNISSDSGLPITLQYSPDNADAITTATTEVCVFDTVLLNDCVARRITLCLPRCESRICESECECGDAVSERFAGSAVKVLLGLIIPSTGDAVLMPTTASNVQYAFTNLGQRPYSISTIFVRFTVTKTSYGFHLHTGGHSGILCLPFPSLLTRYQPIDRGRCHTHKASLMYYIGYCRLHLLELKSYPSHELLFSSLPTFLRRMTMGECVSIRLFVMILQLVPQ
jgi:hypothetical protein